MRKKYHIWLTDVEGVYIATLCGKGTSGFWDEDMPKEYLCKNCLKLYDKQIEL